MEVSPGKKQKNLFMKGKFEKKKKIYKLSVGVVDHRWLVMVR